jgi:hypothetical protein
MMFVSMPATSRRVDLSASVPSRCGDVDVDADFVRHPLVGGPRTLTNPEGAPAQLSLATPAARNAADRTPCSDQTPMRQKGRVVWMDVTLNVGLLGLKATRT